MSAQHFGTTQTQNIISTSLAASLSTAVAAALGGTRRDLTTRLHCLLLLEPGGSTRVLYVNVAFK